jgi:hypothetical protein
MLTPEQVKPLLSHSDRFVRLAAARYFTDSYSPDPDVLPRVVKAYVTHRTFEDGFALAQVDHLAPSQQGVESFLSCLGRRPDTAAIDTINRTLAALPLELARPLLPSLGERVNVRPETVNRLERRVQLAGRSGEDLWRELQDFAGRSEEKQYVGEIDHGYADDLVDALAPRAVPDDATVCRLLNELTEDQGWLESFVIDLAGARRVRAAVPALVAKFRIDADYTRERTQVALARIGDLEAVRLVRDLFPLADWHVRLFSSGVFDTIKAEETERAVLDLLEQEEDDGIRTNLCESLCRMFSADGLPAVLKVIEEGSYDRTVTHLEESVLTVADVLGVALPPGDEWRRLREQESVRLARAYAEMSSGADEPGPLAASAAEDYYTPPIPFQHTEARVGRNDPCPCGSGKKFKKCCGRG